MFGFISTSKDKDVAKYFANKRDKKGVLFIIDVPEQ